MALLDTVRTQVHGVQYGRLAVSALLIVPYVVGWLLGKAATVLTALLYATGWVAGKVSLSARYAGTAVKVGWTDARTKADKPGGGRWAS